MTPCPYRGRPGALLWPAVADDSFSPKDPVCGIIVAAAERWATATAYTPGPSDM